MFHEQVCALWCLDQGFVSQKVLIQCLSSQPELHTLKITFPGVFVMLKCHGRELWNHEQLLNDRAGNE